MKSFKQVEDIDMICELKYQDLEITEAEYQGKKVKLNDPIRGGSKKFYVYVKDGDKVKKVSFGDTTGLSIKRDDPARRKSFRASGPTSRKSTGKRQGSAPAASNSQHRTSATSTHLSAEQRRFDACSQSLCACNGPYRARAS